MNECVRIRTNVAKATIGHVTSKPNVHWASFNNKGANSFVRPTPYRSNITAGDQSRWVYTNHLQHALLITQVCNEISVRSRCTPASAWRNQTTREPSNWSTNVRKTFFYTNSRSGKVKIFETRLYTSTCNTRSRSHSVTLPQCYNTVL